eukprot:TRINITY_DN27507_c0_g1_i1.p1 TRINITY_DN27507_c0_g1~~TRINITY_DN27507_c0_g1_i1.p1  ORF type:complete len:135 (+),score=38.15 TRINITY_DN27507_c0_g1_i1:182-586(+)
MCIRDSDSTMLRSVMLLVRPTQLASSIKFFNEGLGLPLLAASDTFAELETGSSRLILQAAHEEAACSTGYSPMLKFEVSDLDSAIPELIMRGGILDGPIKYPRHGKVAALRTPDGHMIAVHERVDEEANLSQQS